MRWPRGYHGRNGTAEKRAEKAEPRPLNSRLKRRGRGLSSLSSPRSSSLGLSLGRGALPGGCRRNRGEDFIGDVSIATARLIRRYEPLLAASVRVHSELKIIRRPALVSISAHPVAYTLSAHFRVFCFSCFFFYLSPQFFFSSANGSVASRVIACRADARMRSVVVDARSQAKNIDFAFLLDFYFFIFLFFIRRTVSSWHGN